MTDDQTRPGQLEALESAPIDDADGHALATLRRIYEVGDPVPPSLLDRVKFAITLDDLEAEVARLQREAVPELARGAVGGPPQGADGHLHERDADDDGDDHAAGDERRPHGRLGVPRGGLDVELRVGDKTHHTVADEDGRFVFEQVAHGLAQFVLRQNGGGEGDHAVITPAIEI